MSASFLLLTAIKKAGAEMRRLMGFIDLIPLVTVG